jgi:two-component system, NarL family, sensor histidine kinase DesK
VIPVLSEGGDPARPSSAGRPATDVPSGPGVDFRDPTRLGQRKWALMTGGWALLLAPVVVQAVTSDLPLQLRIPLTLAVLGYIACYVVGLYNAMIHDRWVLSIGLIVLMLGLWTAVVAGVGDGGVYTISFLLAAVAILTPPRWSAPATLTTCVVGLGVGWLVGVAPTWDSVFSMIAIGLAMIAMFGVIRANSELREAREELARMAVATDRERMARDLHDVLGHSLTTITVKAGLARRLLERGEDERAATEVSDVERLGRQALADVRATVSANRVASLAKELVGAREALRAAEITPVLPQAVDDVPEALQQAFAHVVREGVTNTIRHSGASTCTVRLAPDSVEVIDDGVGAPADTAAGNGLDGLSERLAAVGGWVEAGPRPEGGYRLRAEVTPARRRVRRANSMSATAFPEGAAPKAPGDTA